MICNIVFSPTDSQQVRPFPLVQILSSITNISLSALDYQISTHRICFYSPETIPGAVEWFKETSNGRIAGLRQKLKTLSAESLVNVSSPPRKRTYAG